MPLPDDFNLPDEYPTGFNTDPIPGANEPMRQERSYSEIVNTSLYDLLGDLGLTADSSITKYFTPYDPTTEQSIQVIGKIQTEKQIDAIAQELEASRDIMGKTGLASSFTQSLAEQSGISAGRSELEGIQQGVKRAIFEEQKKFAEDFYDTVSDLAQLEVFNQPESIPVEDDEGIPESYWY